jgi:hypothetical protein
VVVLKIVILILFLARQLLASDTDLAIKIYNSIALECTQKKEPKIYLHGELESLYDTDVFNRTYECADADFVITDTLKMLPQSCDGKIIFTNKYRLFMQEERILGAFFWQKGRPNIIFDKKRLERDNITLSPSFNKYIE